MPKKGDCGGNRELVVKHIQAAFTEHDKQANAEGTNADERGGEKNRPLQNILAGVRQFARGEATEHRHGYCPCCFAHALIRLYDASLDWMIVHGRLNDDAAVLTIPVFVALFAEIGNSEIPEEDIEARVSELCAKQGGIIKKYRKQARRSMAKRMAEAEAKRKKTDVERRKVVLNKVMSDVKLVPAFRFRKCSPECDRNRADIDTAVNWLEGDKGGTPAREVNKRHSYITRLKDGVAGHFDRLRGLVPKKRGHLVTCEPCFLYLIVKTCGTKWAGRWLVDSDAGAVAWRLWSSRSGNHGDSGAAEPTRRLL